MKDDVISRQQAIDALMERFKRVPTNAIIVKDVIENLPSAQPELIAQDAYVRGFEQGRTQGKVDADLQQKRKTGYWILYDKRFPWLYDYKCSQCGKRLSFSDLSGEAKFCPYCGAKMKGVLNA